MIRWSADGCQVRNGDIWYANQYPTMSSAAKRIERGVDQQSRGTRRGNRSCPLGGCVSVCDPLGLVCGREHRVAHRQFAARV